MVIEMDKEKNRRDGRSRVKGTDEQVINLVNQQQQSEIFERKKYNAKF